MTSVIHFTTVHTRTDTRIWLKQVSTIDEMFDVLVALYVQDGLGDEQIAGRSVVDTGPRPSSRLARMTIGAWRMLRAVLRAKPTIAHFHDPELIPAGLLLKMFGIKVVYDVHEDLPRQIAGKHWIAPALRRPVAWLAGFMARIAGVAFDAIAPATPAIAEHFPRHKTTLVQNFPMPDELVLPEPSSYNDRPTHFAYVGGISRPRGAFEMVQALSLVDKESVRLQMAGSFTPTTLEETVRATRGWDKVDFHGWASRRTVADLLGQVRAGLVLFHPAPNHIAAQPNKLFEYMAAGLPLIASDFPLWRRLIDEIGSGLLVDPHDPEAIANAIQWILDNPDGAEAMGQRGRKAVLERYNWDVEGAKLVALYERLLGQPSKIIGTT